MSILKNREYKNIKIKFLKFKNMSEVKNTLNGINRRLDTSGEKINGLEDTAMETTQFGIRRGKKVLKNRKEQSISVLWDNLKWPDIQRESQKEKNGGEKQKKIIEEIKAKIFPHLMKNTNPYVNSPRRNMKTRTKNKKQDTQLTSQSNCLKI